MTSRNNRTPKNVASNLSFKYLRIETKLPKYLTYIPVYQKEILLLSYNNKKYLRAEGEV